MSIYIRELLENKIGNSRLFRIPLIKKILFIALGRILYINRINRFLENYSHLGEKRFIAEIFEELNFSYAISDIDIQKIPSEGRVICVANHPIGSLDALSLIKAIYDVRKDIKVIANDVLYALENLRGILIPLRLDTPIPGKESIIAIEKALEEEAALIIFPAASVSRLKGLRVADGKWQKGCVHFARKFNAPILPVHIEAKNSLLFYFVSIFSKKISMFLLAHELFNKKNKTINIRIGEIIPSKAFTESLIEEDQHTLLLKKHVYLIGRQKKGVYTTEKNVIPPGDRKQIRRELNNSRMLGITKDNMRVFLASRSDSPELMHEISRLREITFRKVGEGTGKRYDLDKYDDYYEHLIVWDENELDIVGAYRIGSGQKILPQMGEKGFYTSSLFTFKPELVGLYLKDSIELGRSFVQKKYWNTNALSHLWQGIGTYLVNNPSVRFMFGGVSISSNYPPEIRTTMIYYFAKWYNSDRSLAEAKNRFVLSRKDIDYLNSIFTGTTPKEDYKILKSIIRPSGHTVPPLYKHYSDLCEDGGVKFLDFGIDPGFENCIDGLILVDTNLIKNEKRKKYFAQNFSGQFKAMA